MFSEGEVIERGYDQSWNPLGFSLSTDLGQSYKAMTTDILSDSTLAVQRVFKKGNKIIFDVYDTKLSNDRMFLSTDGRDTKVEVKFPEDFVKSRQIFGL